MRPPDVHEAQLRRMHVVENAAKHYEVGMRRHWYASLSNVLDPIAYRPELMTVD